MRLRRQQTKKEQALDMVATAAKAWSEWQLAKKATKGVRRGAKAAAETKLAARVAPVKAITAAVIATGLGALVAKKLKRRGGAQTYSPPVQPPAPVTPTVPPPATPGSPGVDPGMDVDAPNESAPGHHPQGEEAAR